MDIYAFLNYIYYKVVNDIAFEVLKEKCLRKPVKLITPIV